MVARPDATAIPAPVAAPGSVSSGAGEGVHADAGVSSLGATGTTNATGATGMAAWRRSKDIAKLGVERSDVFGRRRRYFSAEECAKHSTADDCWLIAHGKVYDVSAFISRHPAGELAIIRKGGTDATQDFDFHSSRARRMWSPFVIGYLEPAEGSDCVLC